MTLLSGRSIQELLAGIELFAGIDQASLARLATEADVRHLPGGETLIREGDPSDALFAVASGRLQAFVGNEGGETLVGEIGRGEVIGEMGILADEPRSATVRALRDSNLVHIPADAFVRFLREEPDELFAITQLLIQRLRRSIRSEAAGASVRTITVVPVGGGAETATFARYLTSILAERSNSLLVTGQDVEQAHEDDLTRLLHDLETTHDLLVYLADPDPSAWTDRCLRQADRVVLVGEAGGESALTEVERSLLGSDGGMVRARVDLVLIQPPEAELPRGGSRWLAQRPVHRLHHVRLHSRDDVHRVARALTGREIALVLSGGGARGIAHFGLFRALDE
ncbi:MAG: cyclic nucleotide-binding and patatin-like phospholipase domain-containing protein, partial [Acidimicrobiia bacterium]